MDSTTTQTDRIEKTVVLNAPRQKVWQAVSVAEKFGSWFGVKLEGSFKPGTPISGRLTYPKYEHLTMTLDIERIEPEHYFSYRWHPYAIDQTVDYSSEPTTLVEFRLEDVKGGTRLTIIESGFDRVPLARRAEAFRMNDNGWSQQAVAIEKYVAQP
jgi:uncharacterized protein YndB with AHSA1/START domain